ncbi:DUF4190 domain-containing protein [Microbacterium sp. ARD31]|uniref:DUF4190 domain-containing protein n=1 Tax=Microbacterium sp. ARD31 TaxID=2962576 RepID=UPI002882BC24|nr:DUF4190 domain-containing protein [Microbacterium sp. ARD31]MDT0181209.1 DUF4190 domain-containing protein [Microbacterium sp. ARD31]
MTDQKDTSMTDPNQPNPQNVPPAPPAYEAPAYSNAPQYNAAPSGGSTPGRTMAIVALILAIIPGTQVIGLILGIVALVQSRKAGAKNGLAIAAIIVSVVIMILVVVVIIIAVAAFQASGGGDLVSQVNACLDDPSGTVTFQGVTMTCQELLENSGY